MLILDFCSGTLPMKSSLTLFLCLVYFPPNSSRSPKPRQRTICTLGRLDTGAEVNLLIAALQKAKGLTANATSLEGLRFVASKDVGDVWALHQLWLSLGFED
jgi:hypothetical protein